MVDPHTSSGVDGALGDQLELLLDQLTLAGIKIGPRERINATILVAELCVNGQVAKFDDLRTWLAPLLARSPADRERFFQVFDLFTPQESAPDNVGNTKLSSQGGLRISVALAAVLLVIVCVIAWRFFLNSQVEPHKFDIPPSQPGTSTSLPPSKPPLPPQPLTSDALKRIADAAEHFESAPTLEELGRELSRQSPIGWPAASYTIRLSELTGLPKNWPVALYGPNADDGRVWAMLALALERIEHPGRETAFVTLLSTANKALEKQSIPPPVYAIAARLGACFPSPAPAEKTKLISQVQECQSPDGKPSDTPDALTVQRAFAISDDPRLRRTFVDAPWVPIHPASGTPWWTAWVAMILPLGFAVFWFANSLALRKAYLRRRPPELPPLHLDIVAEAATRIRYAASAFQRITQKLLLRTPQPANCLDVEASIAATIADGGELLCPVYQVSRHMPEYLVLIERRSAGDQDAQRLRDLIGGLEAQLPLTVYYYYAEPSYLEPEQGGRSESLEELQARYGDHRLLVLGSGAEFLNPLTLEPYAAVEKLRHWPQRALLTPLPLAEWGREEFALAQELQMPVGRATTEGLLTLAELLGLEGAETDRLVDPRGDGLARPLPEILRISQQRFLYSAPPSAAPAAEILRHLRNFLDGPGFEWLCALAVYPSVQWDLTLYLGIGLPSRQGGDATIAPLYQEQRIAALTQLPWLREGYMPNWLRKALINELEPGRAHEIRDLLSKLISTAGPSNSPLHDAAVKLRISREPPKDQVPPEELLNDEVLLDFLARGRIEDFALPRMSWLERFLPRGLLDRIGIPELTAALVAIVYAAAAFVLSPKPADGALMHGAWLPLCCLFGGALFAMVIACPALAYGALRHAFARLAVPILALSALLTSMGLLKTFHNFPIRQGAWEEASLLFVMGALCLFFARKIGGRSGIRVYGAATGRWRRILWFAGKAAALSLIAVAVTEVLDGLWPSESFAWVGASGVGVTLFVVAAAFLRFAPKRLRERIVARGRGIHWGAGVLRVAMALAPILPAAWLSVYVASSSVRLPDIPGGATTVAELRSRSLIAIGGADGKVRIIDLETGEPRALPPIDAGASPISDLALGASGNGNPSAPVRLAVTTADGRLRLFDARGGSPLSLPEGFVDTHGSASKIHVAFGPDGEPVVAFETTNGKVQLATGKGVLDITDSGPVTALAVSGEKIALATLDGRIRLAQGTDANAPTLLKDQGKGVKLSGHARMLDFERNGQSLVALADNGEVVRIPVTGNMLNTEKAASITEERLVLGAAVKWRSGGKVAVMVRTSRGRDKEQWLKPGEGKTESFQDCIDNGCNIKGPEMVVVPKGRFMMGSTQSEIDALVKEYSSDWYKNEGPQRKVTLAKPFAVGKFEVTFAEWDACVADGGCGGYQPKDESWGRGNRPVINVNWNDAQAYVKWLSGKTGKEYRLLTEAEWEYAARAGSTTRYWWGDAFSNKEANNGSKTVPVKTYQPNSWGLYQVHGNVYEWVEDVWHKNYNGAPDDGTAWLKGGDATLHVVRGGSWHSGSRSLPSAYRSWNNTDDRNDGIGFRIARTL